MLICLFPALSMQGHESNENANSEKSLWKYRSIFNKRGRKTFAIA